MKILKLSLFQETVCYKKPFAFKVAETYPLPPYSTVIGMIHKILDATEYIPMNISVQGEWESIFNNYQNLRMYKSKDEVTAMPRNIHLLLNVNLIIHIKAEDEVINKIVENINNGVTFTLGRNEDLVRVDKIKILENVAETEEIRIYHNAYVPEHLLDNDISGINYRLNTKYTIDKNNTRKWEKVNVKYVEKGQVISEKCLVDDENDVILFYMER